MSLLDGRSGCFDGYIDYLTIYNYICICNNFNYGKSEEFYKLITSNHNDLDTGYMKFMEYLRKIYYESK